MFSPFRMSRHGFVNPFSNILRPSTVAKPSTIHASHLNAIVLAEFNNAIQYRLSPSVVPIFPFLYIFSC
jgi:hypothetical protein